MDRPAWLDRALTTVLEFLQWDFGIPLLILGLIVLILLRYPRLIPGLFAGRGVEEISFGVTGIRVRLAAERLIKANKIWDLPSPDSDEIRHWLASLVRIPHILWVYDDPKSVKHEIEALEYLGYEVEVVTTNRAAAKHVARRPVDVIVSDIDRKKEGLDAGLKLRAALDGLQNPLPPIFFYVGQVDAPTTPDGDKVTNMPLVLFRNIAEALDNAPRKPVDDLPPVTPDY